MVVRKWEDDRYDKTTLKVVSYELKKCIKLKYLSSTVTQTNDMQSEINVK